MFHIFVWHISDLNIILDLYLRSDSGRGMTIVKNAGNKSYQAII